ncbi:MAG TPA: hypothetical protein VNH46_12675 [Gemmatimonadales bacterium]|nr:hypothetical protein [Gemmatimonadales bacterium]
MPRSSSPSQELAPRKSAEVGTAATAPAAARTTSLQWAAAGSLLILHLAAVWATRIPGLTTRNDDAAYVLLARSLRSLSGYRDLYQPGAPPHVQYPPGYPAILAAVSFFTGESVHVYLLVGALLSMLGLLLWFDIARRLWSPAIGLALLAAVVLNPSLVRYGGTIMAEPALLFWSSVGIWALALHPESRRWAVIGAVAVLLAALTRSAGVTLIGAVGAEWLLRRRYRALAAFSLASLASVGSWLAWTLVAAPAVAGRSYVADATRLIEERYGWWTPVVRILRTGYSLPTSNIPSILSVPTIEGTRLDNIFWLVFIVVLGGAGLWACWKRCRLLSLYAMAVIGLMLVWRWTLTRFLNPLVPLIVLILLAGALQLGQWTRPVLGRALILVLVASLLLSGMASVASVRRLYRACDRAHASTSPGCFNPDQLSYFAAARYARDSLPRGSVFLAAKEATFAYYSGQQVVYPSLNLRDENSFRVGLQQRGVQYVVLGRTSSGERAWLSRRLLDFCRDFSLQARFPPRSLMLRLLPEADSTASAAACAAVAAYRADTTELLPVR